MSFHAIAVLSGNRQKTIPNKTESQILTDVVIPFVNSGVITAKWGSERRSYQVLELRIYETSSVWDKRQSTLAEHIKRKRNIFSRFENRANDILAVKKPRVFVVTPIQGDKMGDQDQQRVHREYDERFETIERVISDAGGVAIRIDKEHAIEDLVGRIKKEIRGAIFIVADMTDERPSCYFEVGYAEGIGKPIVYIASKQSVLHPGTATKIHFDIHQNVLFFSNLAELDEKLANSIEKNRRKLFDTDAIQLSGESD
ncbi:nucleoside 2-deoxyribosyltransferase [Granulicella cerasi]|uniref:Nucleoside 2-deoxyribosyltransferase n=1 Tax=Granulicella cerasi TaxID=741063 RepID=A0ABW1ZCX8_9BACT|nr:nucleoside 2-deoxyribosyltransferase [Granulicella cerasi]